MSIKMEASEVVAMWVEHLLPRGSGDKKVLQVVLRVTATNAKTGEQVEQLGMFIFHRPGCYMKVLWNTTEDLHARHENFSTWKLKVNHDSAWRSDGIESTLRELESEMRKQIHPVSYSKNYEVSADFFFKQPEVVRVRACDYNQDRTCSITW